MRWRLITISGFSGTGKSRLSQDLSQSLGWPLENASSLGLNKKSTAYLLTDDQHRAADNRAKELISEGQKLILDSRLGGWQAKEFPDIFRVLCTTDWATKISRYAKREGLSEGEAAKQLKLRDEQDQAKFLKLYNLKDYLNPGYFHLIISTDQYSVEEEVQLVLDSLESRSYAKVS